MLRESPVGQDLSWQKYRRLPGQVLAYNNDNHDGQECPPYEKMKVAKVIGTVTLNRSHELLTSGRFKLVVPMSLDNLAGTSEPTADTLVAWDDLGAGIDSLIALSDGREAAMPFYPEVKPVDAYNAALLDEIELDESALHELKTAT